MKKSIFFLCLIFSFYFISVAVAKNHSKYKYELSIASVFQNEAPYLKEWIDYHKKMGVQHFWLYNNNSEDNYKEVLAPYIAEGVVELKEWPSTVQANDWSNFTYGVQVRAFNDALKKARNVSKWLALIDSDEFILPMKENNIIKCLNKRYDKVAGLCISWVCFGTANVEKIPSNEPITDYLVMRSEFDHPMNKQIKSIVKPVHVMKCINPHVCKYEKGFHQVNTDYERIVDHNEKCLPNTIRINHYWTRDEWFLKEVKLPRHVRWGDTSEKFLEAAASLSLVLDTEIQKKLNALVSQP